MWLVLTHHVSEYVPNKTGEYPSDIPQFSWLHVLQKIFER